MSTIKPEQENKIQELSLKECEEVGGGLLFAIWGAFALTSLIGFGGAVAGDQLD